MLDVHHKGRAVVSSGSRRRPSSTSSASTNTGCGPRCSTIREFFPAVTDPADPARHLPRRAARGGTGPPAAPAPPAPRRWWRARTRPTAVPGASIPPAYTDDAEADADYQRLMREDLEASRLAALDAVEARSTPPSWTSSNSCPGWGR